MTTLINLYNQLGAGPKNISLNLINGLEKRNLIHQIYIIVPDYAEYSELRSGNPRLQLIKYPRKHNLLGKMWFRLYLELWLIPRLIRRYSIRQLLAFGNFLFTPGNFTKLVLCHHPYLYDDALLSKSSLSIKLTEYLKRIAFALTLWNVRHLVVQSEYVANQLRATWHLPEKMDLHVIPNPISNNFQSPASPALQSLMTQRWQAHQETIKILYVSRFYPHKNHQFLLNLSLTLKEMGIAHVIEVTIDPQIEGAQEFLDSVSDMNLPIINLGEQEQKQMVAIYRQAHLFVFPSHAETFGNPMIEAMCYGLPLVLPDLGYAREIASSAGNYYPAGDASACATCIKDLLSREEYYQQRSQDSHNVFTKFPTVDEWIGLYLQTLKQSRQPA